MSDLGSELGGTSDLGSELGGTSGLGAAPAAGPDLHSFGRTSTAAAKPPLLRAEASSADASVRADGGDLPGWALRAASVAGVRHRLAGVGGDDAYAWSVVGPDADGAATVVVAVADGVGSVAGSGAAARAAVAAACAAVRSVLVGEGPAGPDTEAAPGTGRMGALAAGGPGAIGEAFTDATVAVAGAGGATTLVVAAVDHLGRGWAARVGDSSALVLGGHRWRPLWPADVDPDRPASTATAALPSSSPDVEVAEVHLATGEALVLVTDGIADPLRDGPTTVAPALAERLAGHPSPIELAGLVDFSRHGCIDDRTLLALWRTAGG